MLRPCNAPLSLKTHMLGPLMPLSRVQSPLSMPRMPKKPTSSSRRPHKTTPQSCGMCGAADACGHFQVIRTARSRRTLRSAHACVTLRLGRRIKLTTCLIFAWAQCFTASGACMGMLAWMLPSTPCTLSSRLLAWMERCTSTLTSFKG